MADRDTPKPPDRSRRAVILATMGIVVILGLAVFTIAFWSEIQLRYHRHYFRHGTTEEQIRAFEWICEHRLETDMTKGEVERALGEPLNERFDGHTPRKSFHGPHFVYMFHGYWARLGKWDKSGWNFDGYLLAFDSVGKRLEMIVSSGTHTRSILKPPPRP